MLLRLQHALVVSFSNLPFVQFSARNSDPWRVNWHRINPQEITSYARVSFIARPPTSFATCHGSPHRAISVSAIKWNTRLRAILSSRDSSLAALFSPRARHACQSEANRVLTRGRILPRGGGEEEEGQEERQEIEERMRLRAG